jgi:hypothetical protein
MKAISDGQPLAAGFPLARRHRFVRDEQIVQPAGPGQADFVGRFQHARRRAQQFARMVERERLQEGFRRQAAPAAEQMMQIGRGNAGGFGDGLDLGLRAPMAADMGDGAAHDIVIGRRRKRCEFCEAVGHGVSCQFHVAIASGLSDATTHPIWLFEHGPR